MIIIIIAAVLVVVALLIVIYLKVLKKGGRAKLGDSSLGQTSPSKKSPSPAKKGEMLAMVSSPLGGSPKQSPRPVVSPKGPLQPVREDRMEKGQASSSVGLADVKLDNSKAAAAPQSPRDKFRDRGKAPQSPRPLLSQSPQPQSPIDSARSDIANWFKNLTTPIASPKPEDVPGQVRVSEHQTHGNL